LRPLCARKISNRNRSRFDQLPQGDSECPHAAGLFHSFLFLLLVAVLGILSVCQSRCLRHHSVLSEVLGIEFRHPHSDFAFRYFFRQVEVVAL
jgi:hypothetical protein